MRESWELLLEDPVIRNGVNRKTGCFVKGHRPYNKGLKMEESKYPKCAPTMFKKGNVSKKKYIPGGCKTSKRIEMLKNDIVVTGFISMTDAERRTGINRENIRAVCQGKRKKAGGFEWRYIESAIKSEVKIIHKELMDF